MVLKRKDPGRTYSPSRARKALSRSGLGLCRSPRRGLSTSFHTPSKPTPCIRPGGRPAPVSKGASANMKVVVRVRPLSRREQDNNARVIVDVVDEKMVVFDPKREEESFFFQGVKQKGRDMLKKQNKNAQFLFDRVFGQEASNEEVFEGSTKSIVASVLDGFNCSVFVYGATGAGKTYTMLGTQENPGITFRTMVDLFTQMESQKVEKDFDIGVSYLEVYNEQVRDLLNPASGALHLREDGGGVIVAGLKMERISDPNRMFEHLEYGNKNRSQHPTDANAESSRSHAVFQVFIKMKTKANGQTKMVKLSMIDLAGSERGAATGCAGVRFKEGSNINKSLLALGNCINALADGLRHIPYRDSKLTRLLKDSLGGNCQTVMIANVAPAHHTFEDTHNTLKYATRAKSIKFQIKRNIVSVELHVSHYIKMVEDLQAENERLKKEFEEYKAKHPPTSQAPALLPAPSPVSSPPKQSHLPPVVAAAVAAINNKAKITVTTSTVAINTSPCKRLSNSEDLLRLKNEAQQLYCEKAQLHQRYLNMDSSDKVLRLRIKMKQRTIDRVQAMSSTPIRMDKAQIKVDKSVGQFTGRLTSVNECQEAVSLEEREINHRLEKIREELQRLGIFEEISPYLTAFELEFLNQELTIKCQHLEKLVEYLDREFESQDELLKKISPVFRNYYYLVKGHGHMTEEMKKEHETLMRNLEGVKAVTWKGGDEVQSTTVRTWGTNRPSSPTQFEASSPSLTVSSHDSGSCSGLPPKVDTVLGPSDPLVPCSPMSAPVVKDLKSPILLQSPLCSSSSNPSIIPQALDTASMLDSLGLLDSKVENILNTSVSSTAVEVSYPIHDPLGNAEEVEPRNLNVTFDAEANLNSTFSKEDPPEPTVNLNETFEKPDENKFELPVIAPVDQDNQIEKLNGTFSLEENSTKRGLHENDGDKSATLTEKQNSVASLAMSSTFVGPLMKKTSSQSPAHVAPTISLSKKQATSISSPSLLAPSRRTVTSASSPTVVGSNVAFTRKPTSSPPVSAPNAAPFRKPGAASSSSPTFAVPNAPTSTAAMKSHIGLKKTANGGNGDRRKALSSNLLAQKPSGIKVVGMNRKTLGANPRLLNAPSKVKLAWNKENRSGAVNFVNPSTTAKVLKIGYPKTAVVKTTSASSHLNGTFTKEPSTS